MGTELSPEVKENLSRSNNAGCVVELELARGVRESCLLSLNPKTNRLHHVPVSEITIPQEVNRVRLSDDQTTRLARGGSCWLRTCGRKETGILRRTPPV
ncbi:DUF3945 domain-containing protein [Bacteroides ovatus]|nr:DUF3945 domain-containing protein [Bacteroides ovatus]